jgi:26S proteasome regulatory subunit N8
MNLDTTPTPMNVDVENDQNDDSTGTAILSTQFQKLRNISEVIVHPLVLLSVADHYNRVARGTRKRVIGILLGQVVPSGSASVATTTTTTTTTNSSSSSAGGGGSIVDVTNSFALPFEEDSKNPVS